MSAPEYWAAREAIEKVPTDRTHLNGPCPADADGCPTWVAKAGT